MRSKRLRDLLGIKLRLDQYFHIISRYHSNFEGINFDSTSCIYESNCLQFSLKRCKDSLEYELYFT